MATSSTVTEQITIRYACLEIMQYLAPPLAGLPSSLLLSSSCCVVQFIHNKGFNLIFTIYSTVACRTTLRESEIEESIYCPKPGKYFTGWSTVYLACLRNQKLSSTAGPRDLSLSSTFLSMLDMREKDDFMSKTTYVWNNYLLHLQFQVIILVCEAELHYSLPRVINYQVQPLCLMAGFLREVQAQLVLLGLRASSLLYYAQISLSF